MRNFNELEPVTSEQEPKEATCIMNLMEKTDVVLEKMYDRLVGIMNGLTFTGPADIPAHKDPDDMRSAANEILSKAGTCAIIVEEIFKVLYGMK